MLYIINKTSATKNEPMKVWGVDY